MLLELYVRNFALIEEISLHFGDGLNVVTGETGAGKSILIDALGLVLGGRSSSEMVRQGSDKAIVEALFHVTPGSRLSDVMQELGIDWEDDTLVVVREVSASGKSVCRINGRIVTVQTLRMIGSLLVDLAGQHEHQSLLRPEEHLEMLDSFAGDSIHILRQRVSNTYEQYRAARRALEQAAMGEQERAQRIDMLRFQLEEIRSLGIKPGEEDQLEEERRKLAHAEKLSTAASNVFECLYQGGARQASIIETLHKLTSEMTGVLKFDPNLQPVAELIQSSALQLEEAAHELRSYRDSIEYNPARLQSIEERLAVLARLRRKYGQSVAEILDYAGRIASELDDLEHHEENIGRLQQNLFTLEQQLAKEATELSLKRKAYADKLSKRIAEELASLMMPKTRFQIDFQADSSEKGILVNDQRVAVNEKGIDRVEFLFSPNPGEPLRPLVKIASGGELSRTLLAIKTILSGEGVETLVFDEIDTGISGRAAQAVAEKMSVVAHSSQVICVTHLPQVACMADRHFVINKQQKSGRSLTIVNQLNDSERVEELARMLSGAELTDTTRKHAEEMLLQAQALKNKFS
ncbi:DNA repair protein RecN [Effusibacillus lacus]|uniref:DNA repair protein RecN n=1 Tax=Effusibacillus lacus TaxID=1348429 RepID=A0A292YR90_9BACL|nr:DNA repair protein RecN [Effusibacillus lacus]TCS72511.1 DNA replication and repair protein RecN [Effusibacillus lacus]GAX90924.1 DNA repair protein RecN [Effusibacillus lacus]